MQDEGEALRRLAAKHRSELENLSRRKDEFIAIASHDLKTPLTAILAYSQYAGRLLAAPVPDLDRVAHAIRVIEDQSRAMATLLEDLLDASRIQLDEFELRRAPCDIAASLGLVLARLDSDERKRIDVMAPATPMTGHLDQKRIEQVFANLISNALKYSPNDARVSVAIKRGHAGIEVVIGDKGLGIPTNELGQVFARFHRTPQARATGLGGSGLGLYICQGIITAHGGRLWAESPGEHLGATFRFTLPDHSRLGLK